MTGLRRFSTHLPTTWESRRSRTCIGRAADDSIWCGSGRRAGRSGSARPRSHTIAGRAAVPRQRGAAGLCRGRQLQVAARAYTVATLYVAPKWHEGAPLEEGWIQRANARDFSSLILYSDEYDSGARRFDMGERRTSRCCPPPYAPCSRSGMEEWKSGDLGHDKSPAWPSRPPTWALLATGAAARPALFCLRRGVAIPPELTQVLARKRCL